MRGNIKANISCKETKQKWRRKERDNILHEGGHFGERFSSKN